MRGSSEHRWCRLGRQDWGRRGVERGAAGWHGHRHKPPPAGRPPRSGFAPVRADRGMTDLGPCDVAAGAGSGGFNRVGGHQAGTEGGEGIGGRARRVRVGLVVAEVTRPPLSRTRSGSSGCERIVRKPGVGGTRWSCGIGRGDTTTSMLDWPTHVRRCVRARVDMCSPPRERIRWGSALLAMRYRSSASRRVVTGSQAGVSQKLEGKAASRHHSRHRTALDGGDDRQS